MALALGALSASYAEIVLKDTGNGNVEIKFLFADPASEMGVIGSFDNWTVPGEPMTKNADGVWEKTITALATDEIVYKFYSKGSYIFDEQAPDKKDDGYGGHNGLIVVADILSGVTPMKPGAAAPPAPGETVVTSKLNFGMYTIVGSKSTFSTQGVVDKTQKGLETDSTGLYAKSYWKVGGTLVPGVNVWFEMKAFESYQPLWEQDSRGDHTTELNDGVRNLVGGLLTNPVNYLNGGSNPVLNSVKSGLETPVLAWETGYGYAKPQKRTALLWETLEERDANDGYMRFDLGPSLKKLGSATLEATFAPNLMTGNYGLFSWVGFSMNDTKLDFQYDAKSAATNKLGEIFDKLYHQDYLFGARTKVAGVEVTAQTLVNQFSEAEFQTKSNVAAEVKASWALNDDVLGGAVGYRFTGAGVELLYGNNDDSLGTKGTQRLLLNAFGKPVKLLKIGADTTATLTTEELSDTAVELYAKPYVEYDLKTVLENASNVAVYVKANYNLKPGFEYVSSGGAFEFGEAGAKWYLSDPLPGATGLDLYYGLNNWDDDKAFQTLIGNLNLARDVSLQSGLGLRTVRDTASDAVKDANNLVAFTLGGSVKIAEPALKTPLFYAAFVYNMDPYDDGTNNLDWSDYVPDGGVAKSDGKAILRVLMKWDF